MEYFRNNLIDLGEDPTPYGTHSFRRGGCQYLCSERRWDIRKLCDWGGWSTFSRDAWDSSQVRSRLGYRRRGSLVRILTFQDLVEGVGAKALPLLQVPSLRTLTPPWIAQP